jgi:hypothetical protein
MEAAESLYPAARPSVSKEAVRHIRRRPGVGDFEAFHVTMSQNHTIHLKGGASPSAADVFDRPGANSVGCAGLLDDHHKQTSDGRAVSATSHDLAFGNE